VHREENARLVLVADAVAEATGDPRFREMAERAAAHVGEVADDGAASPAVLAELALASELPRVVVLGARGDARTEALLAAARALPLAQRLLERQDPEEPESSGGAPEARVCARGACAAPVHRPEDLRGAMDGLLARR
jgi:uncharacterized protein YyaL (SSP411 family)